MATTFRWDDNFADAVAGVARQALAACGLQAISDMQDDPALPYDTGALHDSLTLHEPGYSQLIGENYVASGVGHRHARVGQPGFDRRPMLRQASAQEAAQAVVIDATGNVATRVGSWLFYAYWVHQGYYNVWRKRQFPARPYVTPHAEAALKTFPAYFRPLWATRARGAAGGGR